MPTLRAASQTLVPGGTVTALSSIVRLTNGCSSMRMISSGEDGVPFGMRFAVRNSGACCTREGMSFWMEVVLAELTRSLRHLWRILVEVARKYGEDRGPLIAAAISFFALLSLVPLALLGVWGLGL